MTLEHLTAQPLTDHHCHGVLRAGGDGHLPAPAELAGLLNEADGAALPAWYPQTQRTRNPDGHDEFQDQQVDERQEPLAAGVEAGPQLKRHWRSVIHLT